MMKVWANFWLSYANGIKKSIPNYVYISFDLTETLKRSYGVQMKEKNPDEKLNIFEKCEVNLTSM